MKLPNETVTIKLNCQCEWNEQREDLHKYCEKIKMLAGTWRKSGATAPHTYLLLNRYVENFNKIPDVSWIVMQYSISNNSISIVGHICTHIMEFLNAYVIVFISTTTFTIFTTFVWTCSNFIQLHLILSHLLCSAMLLTWNPHATMLSAASPKARAR